MISQDTEEGKKSIGLIAEHLFVISTETYISRLFLLLQHTLDKKIVKQLKPESLKDLFAPISAIYASYLKGNKKTVAAIKVDIGSPEKTQDLCTQIESDLKMFVKFRDKNGQMRELS